MLANFLRKSTPAHFIYLILLLLAYFTATNYEQFTAEIDLGIVLQKLTFFIVLVFLLSIEVFVIRKNELTKDSAYTLYFALLLLASFNEAFKSEAFLGAALFLMFASRKIYSLRSNKRIIAKVFDASLWIAVAFMYYNWTILFSILLYGALFNFRLLNWRTVLTPFIGWSTVIAIFFSYHLLFDSLPIFYEAFIFDYSIGLDAFNEIRLAVPLLFYIGMAFLAIIVLIPKVIAGSNNFSRSWNTLILQFVVGIIIMLVTPDKNGASIYFVLMPLPIICTNYLELLHSKWIKNAILYAALLISFLPYFL